VGNSRGLRPSGNAALMLSISSSVRRRSPAPAFSSARSGCDAFGIVNRFGRRTRNCSATWRGLAPIAEAVPAPQFRGDYARRHAFAIDATERLVHMSIMSRSTSARTSRTASVCSCARASSSRRSRPRCAASGPGLVPIRRELGDALVGSRRDKLGRGRHRLRVSGGDRRAAVTCLSSRHLSRFTITS
jgi:hypothetical protein